MDKVKTKINRVREIPTQQYLQECFDYGPEIGDLIWKERPLHHFENEQAAKVWNSRLKNKKAGSLYKNNKIMITIDSLRYASQYIIWKLVYNEDVTERIEYINGDTTDNRLCNLRKYYFEPKEKFIDGVGREYLLECFRYEPETGKLYWKERPQEHFPNTKVCNWFNSSFSNKEINNMNEFGYVIVTVNTRLYLAHRLIWELYYDEEPNVIDHINGIRCDNRISNLRNVTQKENMRNIKLPKHNNSGYMGASKLGSRWRSRITVGDEEILLGVFITKEEAALAYQLKRIELFGEDFCFANEDNRLLVEELRAKVKEILEAR